MVAGALRDGEEGRGLCVEIELPVRQGDDAQHA